MRITMDYEKKYKEALERATQKWECGDMTRECLEYIFTELAESEDERIRKYLISFVKINSGINLSPEDAEKMLAWLEKQGEHAKFRDSIQVGDKVTRNQDGVLVNLSQLKRVAKPSDDIDTEKQGEQKPAWSEGDEARFESCIKVLQTSDGYDTVNVKWLESLKDRVLPRPKQEWSKEDERRIEECAREAEDNNCIILAKHIRQLKSIKFIYTWKPSDEQMITLRQVISGCSYDIEPLVEMEEQLKKLREE